MLQLNFMSHCYPENVTAKVKLLIGEVTNYILQHVPVIDINKRRSNAIPLSPAEKRRYCERSSVERTNSDLKDNYGAHHIRVKGHWKVLCHLMFSIIALTVKPLFNMLV